MSGLIVMHRGPSIVLPLLDDVHFIATPRTIESRWTMFGREDQSGARLEVDPLRIAMTVAPDLGSRIRLSDEWIVVRHRAVVVEAEDLASER